MNPGLVMRPAIVTVVAVAIALAVGVSLLRKGQSSAAPSQKPAASAAAAPALEVDVYLVKPETLEIAVPATGRLLARESIDLVSEVSRRLLRIHVQEGKQVKKGELLFELDSAELRAQLGQLSVQLDLAKITAERQQKLLAEGLASEGEAQAAQARHDELLAQKRVIEVTLSKTVIRAPFAGTVGLRRVSEGAWVSSSTVLVSLHDTTQLKLDFSLPERYASLVAPGKAFHFRAEGRGEVFSGTIVAFEPTVDQSSRSVLVRGVVENEKQLLPGTFATVELPLQAQQVFLVPSIAVIPGAAGRTLFVEREGVAHSVLVELGPRSGERVQVLSGIVEGDRVVISNLLRVRPGAKIAPRMPAAGAQ